MSSGMIAILTILHSTRTMESIGLTQKELTWSLHILIAKTISTRKLFGVKDNKNYARHAECIFSLCLF